MSGYRRIHLPRLKACFSVIILCLALTVLDIVVVEAHYRPLQAWDRIWIWHRIYMVIFVLAPVLLVYALNSLTPLYTWMFFVFGLEDTTFYALQGYLPPRYWGVSILGFWEPSLSLVLLINLLGPVTILLFTLGGLERHVAKIVLRL